MISQLRIKLGHPNLKTKALLFVSHIHYQSTFVLHSFKESEMMLAFFLLNMKESFKSHQEGIKKQIKEKDKENKNIQ